MSQQELDAYQDLGKSSWIRIDLEWHNFSDKIEPNPLHIEGHFSYYDEETDCPGYVLYIVDKDGNAEHAPGEYGKFFFMRDMAVDAAEKLGEELGLPVIMGQDLEYECGAGAKMKGVPS